MISVVVCAFSERRWGDLVDAIDSLKRQTAVSLEILVVIDHNDALLERATTAFEGPAVRVVASAGAPGLSGARNTGIEVSNGDIVAFLDDDAAAEPDWLQRLVEAMSEPEVVGAGSWVDARWDPPGRPGWFPETFLWVVGCSYEGLPRERRDIRNPIGAAMAFKRSAFDLVGGFSDGIGRVGSRPLGCEETEFSIRLRQAKPELRIVMEPHSRVRHHVTAERTSPRYFVRRCYYEGRSKRAIGRLIGAGDGLSSERRYVTHVLPRAVGQGIVDGFRRRRLSAVASALFVIVGLVVTAFGYGSEVLSERRQGDRS